MVSVTCLLPTRLNQEKACHRRPSVSARLLFFNDVLPFSAGRKSARATRLPSPGNGLVRVEILHVAAGASLSGKDWFSVFESVLSHLSPSDLGTLRPTRPTRMPGDPRMIPVIKHPYGETLVLCASAGVRRIMALTYVVVWAWQEHRLGSELRGVKPTRRLVLLVDELDAHLHPFWQRTILPAILDIGELLDKRMQMQVVVSTHSPFVLASLETRFDPASDALYHLHLDGATVRLKREEFYKHGDVSSWLTAPIFGLRYARSKDAERILDQAVQLQSVRSTDRVEIQRVSDQLKRVLPSDDPFWRRWVYFADQAGAKL